jgi:hypothetical protein
MFLHNHQACGMTARAGQPHRGLLDGESCFPSTRDLHVLPVPTTGDVGIDISCIVPIEKVTEQGVGAARRRRRRLDH